jgi:hypothetical protein
VRAAVDEAGIASTCDQCEHKSCDGGWQAGIAAASERAHSRWRSGRWYFSSPGYVTFSDEEDFCIDTANDFLLRLNLPESLDGSALYF